MTGRLPVAVTGTLLAMMYVAVIMSHASWDPTALLAVGIDSGPQLEYAEGVLQREVSTRAELGHDGRFFFILANDPLLLAPQENAAFLDLPTYRAQRVLYPLLAGGLGLLTAGLTVWGLIFVNLFAVGLGTYATATVARTLGANQWLGLTFIVNPGVIAELDIDGGGVLALALGMLGLAFVIERSDSWSVVALTGAVLARETMLLFVGGIVVWQWLSRRPLRPALLAVPVLGAFVWRVYAGVRLSVVETSAETSEGLLRNFELVPLRGAIEASARWTDDPTRLIWILSLVAILLLFVRRAWSNRSIVAWSSWPFALLILFLSATVWIEPYDIARAIAPVFVAYPLLLFAKESLATTS